MNSRELLNTNTIRLADLQRGLWDYIHRLEDNRLQGAELEAVLQNALLFNGLAIHFIETSKARLEMINGGCEI